MTFFHEFYCCFKQIFYVKHASVTTGRTCLVIVRVQRVLPFVAHVADHSVKNRIEVIEVSTEYKRTFDVPVVGVTYNFDLRRDSTRNVRCS